MKNIKSFIIGFLLSACMFLFMGLKSWEATTYQLIHTNNNEFITFNTQNGQIEAWYGTPGTIEAIKEYNKIVK